MSKIYLKYGASTLGSLSTFWYWVYFVKRRVTDDGSATGGGRGPKIVRTGRKGVLATNGSDQDKYAPGWPGGALVTMQRHGMEALVLLSTCPITCRTPCATPEIVCWWMERIDINPQQGPRVSVVGHLKPENDTRLHRRFLAKHARAKLYAGFSDFQYYKLTVEKLHYVGGFARALWISKKNAVLPKSAWQDIAVSEESILGHMNSDHQQAIWLYGTKLLKKQGRHWSLIGLDPEGLDLMRADSPPVAI